MIKPARRKEFRPVELHCLRQFGRTWDNVSQEDNSWPQQYVQTEYKVMEQQYFAFMTMNKIPNIVEKHNHK